MKFYFLLVKLQEMVLALNHLIGLFFLTSVSRFWFMCLFLQECLNLYLCRSAERFLLKTTFRESQVFNP